MDEPVPVQRASSNTAAKVILWLIAGVAGMASAYGFVISRGLRPIADDYSSGAVTIAGVGPGIAHFWSSWSGDLITSTANVIMVGWPVAHLPWAVASAVPFVLSALVLSGLVLWMLRPAASRVGVRLWAPYAALGIAMPAIWWSYWWAERAFSGPPTAASFADAITSWQTINAAYVAPTAMLLLVWLLVDQRENGSTAVGAGLCGILGLAIGLAGPVFAVSVLVMLPMLWASFHLIACPLSRVRAISWLTMWSTVLVGAAISHYSPGSVARSKLFPQPSLNSSFLLAQIKQTPAALEKWWSGVWNPGSLVVITVVGALALMIALSGFQFHLRRLVSLGLGLVTFSFVLAVVNGVSESFAYVAWWHQVQVREVLWLGLCCWGAAIGCSCARIGGHSLVRPLIGALGAAGLLVLMASVTTMASGVIDRRSEWEAGPAPLLGIADIETEWVRGSWEQLSLARGVPPR